VKSAVIDASVLVRATIEGDRAALDWLRRAESGEIVGLTPDLIWAEYANALNGYVRHALLGAGDARQLLEEALQLPLTTYPIVELALAALVVAVERGLSAYDASYVALAEAHEARLITADARLASAYARVELIA
jgi:predicted nucleic acid-binding protein